MKVTTGFLTAVLLTVFAGTMRAADYYVAPEGKAENPGTKSEPADIASALAGKQDVDPGDTVWLQGGEYKYPERDGDAKGYTVKLQGAKDKPIHVRPVPGKRVTVDGGMKVQNTKYLWMWDLEILVSEVKDRDRKIEEGGSHPEREIPSGGLNIISGKNSKFINLIVHDNYGTGISFWRSSTNSEIHGCLIYDNGWIAPDRYHGPGIYTQNQKGEKYITDTLIFGNYSTTIQAYGSSSAWVDHYRIIGNIAFAPRKEGGRQRILVGGGRPSKDIVVNENMCYEVPIQIGYGGAGKKCSDITLKDNIVVRSGLSVAPPDKAVTRANNFVWSENHSRPEEPRVILRPNKYDEDRANLTIFNWPRERTVAVDLSDFLNEGDRFHIQNALNYYGEPMAAGTYKGTSVSVSMFAVIGRGKLFQSPDRFCPLYIDE